MFLKMLGKLCKYKELLRQLQADKLGSILRVLELGRWAKPVGFVSSWNQALPFRLLADWLQN
jgi:hypothetical protein